MRPPVALLAYAADEPGRAVFYPFARFSPEWQAIRYALRRAGPAPHHRPAALARPRRCARTRPARTRAAAQGRPSRQTRRRTGSPRRRRRRRRGSGATRSPGSPRPPGTATRSAAGRTSSSTAWRAKRSRRSPTRWRRCARSTNPAVTHASQSTAASTRPPRGAHAPAIRRRSRRATSASPSSAAPGTRPRSPQLGAGER